METLIILHGWQSSKEKWQRVKEEIEDSGIEVIVPDIPGFKPETELKEPWKLDNYLRWFKKLTEGSPLSALGREKFFLMGHSFGGRLAIKFAQKYPGRLKGLILVSSAGIKRESLARDFLERGAKAARALRVEAMPFWQALRKFFYSHILRKTDYLKTSGVLKETIKNVLAEDLTSLLEKISVSTLIVWGKDDKITPLEDAYLMQEKIARARLEILEGVGHTPHLENPQLLAKKVKQFIINRGEPSVT